VKVLLFGKDGQVGWELQRALAPIAEVVALDRSGDGALCGDLAERERIRQTVRTVRPDVIVNAAAYTAVDKAEAEPDLARSINALGPAAIAESSRDIDAWMVHFSTDYVFDGSGSTPWTEMSPTAPLNTYGRTKLEGEQAIQASGCRHLIFRTSWVYAARGSNFARTMLHLAAERETLSIVEDQYGAPTGAELIADVTAHALLAARSNPALAGLYHLAAGGETNWYGYAQYVIEFARAAGRPLKVAADAIRGIPAQSLPTRARRPHNSRLDTTRLRAAFGVNLPGWQSGVTRVLTEWTA